MSIRQMLIALESAGALTRYQPNGRIPLKRRLFLTKEATKDFNDPTSATNVLSGRGFIANAMTRWVTNGRVLGDKKRGLFLDRLEPPPDEIWEIRVTEPSVQTRLFGRFAERDTLILTKFHTRNFLGRKNSANWIDAMAACEQCWNGLFPGIPPLSKESIHEYVSENCDDFPI